MSEGDQWEGEVVTFMAPNKSGWLMKANHQVPALDEYDCSA